MIDTESPFDHPNAPGEPRAHRRDVLKALGGGLGGVATLAASSGTAAASHADTEKESTRIRHDRAWLEYYAPMLDLRHVPQTNEPDLYGWRVSSTDSGRELEVGVYAAEYAVQHGRINLTSHAGDHEWIYVFVDPATGEVDHVSYAAYHWLRGYLTDPYIHSDGTGEHPVFRVANRYHNYIPLTSTPDSAVDLGVDSLGDSESESGPIYWWLDNGMEPALAKGAVHDPWLLARDGPLDAWWSREGAGRTNRYLVDAWATLGFGYGIAIRGSDAADPGDANL